MIPGAGHLKLVERKSHSGADEGLARGRNAAALTWPADPGSPRRCGPFRSKIRVEPGRDWSFTVPG